MIVYAAKLAPILVIVSLLCPFVYGSVSDLVHSQYDYIDNVSINSININGNKIKADITFDIKFTADAWNDFKYKDGSFSYMSDWWENHEGSKIEYAGYKAKLVSIDWTQVEHHDEYDRLNVVFHLNLK